MGTAQPGPSPSCQRWLPEERLQYFPFTSAYEALLLSELLPWGGAGGCQEPFWGQAGLFPWDVPRGHRARGCTHAVVAPAQQLLSLSPSPLAEN